MMRPIKPAPLKGLKRREARAIERCLSFDRKSRPQDAGSFLKLFRGVTKLQQATLAATVVLASVAGYLWYQNYLETNPAVPFSELPTETQQAFQEQMSTGNEAWGFYERDGFNDAIYTALTSYANAYRLHPRNREAVTGLKITAGRFFTGDEARSIRHALTEKLWYPTPWHGLGDATIAY